MTLRNDGRDLGCGPVGLFAVQSARLMGAAQVIAIDHYPHRLDLARSMGAQVIDYSQPHVLDALMEMTRGIGPDAVIDAVGMESHGFAPDNLMDTVKQKVRIGADRAHALRMAIMACRKGWHISMLGGLTNMFPLGALMDKDGAEAVKRRRVGAWDDGAFQSPEYRSSCQGSPRM